MTKHLNHINNTYTASVSHLTTHVAQPSMTYPFISTTSGDICYLISYQHPVKATHIHNQWYSFNNLLFNQHLNMYNMFPFKNNHYFNDNFKWSIRSCKWNSNGYGQAKEVMYEKVWNSMLYLLKTLDNIHMMKYNKQLMHLLSGTNRTILMMKQIKLWKYQIMNFIISIVCCKVGWMFQMLWWFYWLVLWYSFLQYYLFKEQLKMYYKCILYWLCVICFSGNGIKFMMD